MFLCMVNLYRLYHDGHSKFENHPHAYVSMEARMACGMGACYACVVHVKGESDAKNLRVCEEGPVFPTGKVIV